MSIAIESTDAEGTSGMADFSVIICAYSAERYDDLMGAVRSAQRQTLPPREIIVVIDHNRELLRRVQVDMPGVTVLENAGRQGLSAARNTGLTVATGSLVAFMDDDAIAAPDWLQRLSEAYANPHVIGAGGAILPMWPGGDRPAWFPEEFNWVVGCTYHGLPRTTTPVRNLIGCNMSFRRQVFEAVGGFRTSIGRIGKHPIAGEETEFCIRATQHWPTKIWLYKPDAVVHHRVSQERTRWVYYSRRCYAEGLSKALVSEFVGTGDGLASERRYTFRTLPSGVVKGLEDLTFRGDAAGAGRSAAIAVGLAITTAGYMQGKLARLFEDRTEVAAGTQSRIASVQIQTTESVESTGSSV